MSGGNGQLGNITQSCVLADDAAQLSQELRASQETTASQTERIEALEEEKANLQNELDSFSSQCNQLE